MRAAGEVVGVQANTAARFFMRLRYLIASKQPSFKLSGKIEVDESYFGAVRKGKRGRGVAGKVAFFWSAEVWWKGIYSYHPSCKDRGLTAYHKRQIETDSIVYTDTFRSYDTLDVSEFKHYRINHSRLFTNKQNHINGIENFWNQAKRNMRKYNGIKKDNFHWSLKECEWRFNGGNHQYILKQLTCWYKRTKH